MNIPTPTPVGQLLRRTGDLLTREKGRMGTRRHRGAESCPMVAMVVEVGNRANRQPQVWFLGASMLPMARDGVNGALDDDEAWENSGR